MSDTKKTDSAAASADAKESKQQQPVGLDDDDEFEEFAIQDWAANEAGEEDEDVNVWEDNWDDENVETDFSKQLREELAKHGHKAVV